MRMEPSILSCDLLAHKISLLAIIQHTLLRFSPMQHIETLAARACTTRALSSTRDIVGREIDRVACATNSSGRHRRRRRRRQRPAPQLTRPRPRSRAFLFSFEELEWGLPGCCDAECLAMPFA